ncbi:MAG TPA: MBG domain-containing protein [Candidatus Angelobacter sp.]|nr:MBG domain-containing protein [Candidatus Angelobacter sp.]
MPSSKNRFVSLQIQFLQSFLIAVGRVAVLAVLTPALLAAQDSRTVTEPLFPPACTALAANQVAGTLDETNFDTSRIQAALNSCPAGQAVELQAQGGNNAFLIQPLTLPSGVTLLVDAEVTVFTSLNRADYPCPSSSSSDCTPIITVAPGSGSGIMGYGIIDGRGGQTLNGETVSWWTQTPLDPRPRMIQLVNANNFTLYKITLQNSPKFHVFGTGNFLTVWDVKITAPTTSPNTDGIDPSASHDITITNSFISVGDDHIAIKAGQGHVSNITISHNKLYQGHGVSIGSETNAGAESVLVTDFVMDGASALNQNVIRIKSDSSKGGEVKNITYENICARNPGHPLVFNPFNSSSTGTLFPNFHDITVHNMHVLNRQNSSTVEGYSNSSGVTFPLGITLNNVALDGFKTTGTPDFPATQVNHVNFILGPDPVTPVNPGVVSVINALAAVPANQVTVTNNVSNSNPPYPCTFPASFVYLAGELFAPPNDVTVDQNGETVTLSAIVQPIVSGAAAPTGTISILEGANVVGSAPVSGRITQVPVANVSSGSHTYTAQYSGDANYALLNFGSVTIAGTTTVLTPSANPIVYGNSVALTATVTSAGGVPSGALAFQEGSTPLSTVSLDASGTASLTLNSLAAGTHSFTASFQGGGGFGASTSDVLPVTVTPAPLTITADNKTMTFGDPLPAFTYTPTGFVNGETASVLSGSPQLTTVATSSSPAGSYPISSSAGTLTAANYMFNFVDGTLTINPATPAVTVMCPTVTYDGTTHACTGSAAGVGGAAVSGTFAFTYNGSSAAPAAAGTYAVSASFTSSDPSYSNASGTGTLTVNPALLTITANNQTMIFGAPVPALTYTPAGFVGGDTAAVLSGSPQLSTTATSASPVGTYPITIAPGTLAAANYTFTFFNGTFSITPATPGVTVGCPANVVFDGTAHGCTAIATGIGGANVSGTFAITYNGATAAPANAGTYAVSAVFSSSDPNYSNASGAGGLVIGQATPLDTVNCPPAHFDHHRHACAATVSGISGASVAGTVTITYNGSTTPPFAAGTYSVLASFISADPNYTNATAAGTLIISRGHRDGDDGGQDDRDTDDKGSHDDGSRDDDGGES